MVKGMNNTINEKHLRIHINAMNAEQLEKYWTGAHCKLYVPRMRHELAIGFYAVSTRLHAHRVLPKHCPEPVDTVSEHQTGIKIGILVKQRAVQKHIIVLGARSFPKGVVLVLVFVDGGMGGSSRGVNEETELLCRVGYSDVVVFESENGVRMDVKVNDKRAVHLSDVEWAEKISQLKAENAGAELGGRAHIVDKRAFEQVAHWISRQHWLSLGGEEVQFCAVDDAAESMEMIRDGEHEEGDAMLEI